MSRKHWRGNVVPPRIVRPLCVVLAASALSGCGWFDGWFGKASPLQSEPLRPGVDRQPAATGLPPAANRGSYDAGVAPLDDGRNQPLGSVVAAKGGQKAQIEKMEKERAEQEAVREKERAQREAERDREKTQVPEGAAPASPPSDQAPAMPSDSAPPPAPAPAAPPVPLNAPAQR
ncbi:MAG: hypothetical protein KIS73_27290 [Enhydrobacter sp.]|nr:hypothetical protein [Enhydrobacter sp.]